MAAHLSRHTVRYGDNVSTRDVTTTSSTRPVGRVEWPTDGGGDAVARLCGTPGVIARGATVREAFENATWPESA